MSAKILPMARAKRDGGGETTKARIVEAAIQTLRTEGITGTSARAIAATGGFAPALVFYHYGTVDDLLVAAARAQADARVARYAERLADVERLPELVAVARELHREDVAEGHVTVLVQLLAGTASDPEMGERLRGAFDPWIEVVRQTFERVAGTTPLGALVPQGDAAFAVTALFLGIELLTRLGGDYGRGERLFDTFSGAAALLDGALGLPLRPVGGTVRITRDGPES